MRRELITSISYILERASRNLAEGMILLIMNLETTLFIQNMFYIFIFRFYLIYASPILIKYYLIYLRIIQIKRQELLMNEKFKFEIDQTKLYYRVFQQHTLTLNCFEICWM